MNIFKTIIFTLIASFAICVPAQLSANDASKMQGLYKAYSTLVINYLLSEETFLDNKSDKYIPILLDEMALALEKMEDSPRIQSDSFIESRLSVLTQTLKDAQKYFAEGKKNESLWRLRTFSRNCAACHQKVAPNFSPLKDSLQSQKLSIYEHANFNLIIGENKKALDQFATSLCDDTTYSYRVRVDALWKWLSLASSLYEDHHELKKSLQKTTEDCQWKDYEDALIKQWVVALDKNFVEKLSRLLLPMIASEISPYLRLDTPAKGDITEIELLLVLKELKRKLEQSEKPSEKALAFSLLGDIYSKLPLQLVDQFPELFYERCIKLVPGTSQAQTCFAKYNLLLGYEQSGQDGRIPASIEAQIENLKALARKEK